MKNASWSPPEKGVVKVNVDAAFCPLSRAAAIGVVARNDNGLVLAALSAPIEPCKDVEEAEAKAILAGLQLAKECKLKSVWLESDSACAVAAANVRTKNYSQNWSIYKDIRLAKSVLTNCSISFTRRKFNTVAHVLAKQASTTGVCSRWIDPVPSELAELAKQDLVNIESE
jgi:ribonuclease HI